MDEYSFTENKCRILNSAVCHYILYYYINIHQPYKL